MNKPEWAKPDTDNKEPSKRNIPITLTEEEIQRADALAARSGQTRSKLLQRIVRTELYGDYAKGIMGEK